MSCTVVDSFSLVNKFVHGLRNFRFRSVVNINATFDSEVVTSHDARLSAFGLTYDEREVRVGCLDGGVVVKDE